MTSIADELHDSVSQEHQLYRIETLKPDLLSGLFTLINLWVDREELHLTWERRYEMMIEPVKLVFTFFSLYREGLKYTDH
jgi:hypothetical protein